MRHLRALRLLALMAAALPPVASITGHPLRGLAIGGFGGAPAVLAAVSLLPGCTSSSGSGASTQISSSDYGVTVDGTSQVVYLATTDGGPAAPALARRPPTNGSFVFVSLGPAAPDGSALESPRKVVVTARSAASAAAAAPIAATLRPAPVAGPLPPAVSPTAKGGFAFEVGAPGRWVLELGGRYNQSSFAAGLMVFAEFDDPSPPDATDPSVNFFGAGVHRLPLQPSWKLDGEGRGLALTNDSTVYLAPGAIVLGSLVGKNIRNVSIRGRGILAAVFLPGSPPPANMICASSPGCGHSSAVEITGGLDIGCKVIHAPPIYISLVILSGNIQGA
jgi:hypothetical protein